jgi:hypothetical protein
LLCAGALACSGSGENSSAFNSDGSTESDGATDSSTSDTVTDSSATSGASSGSTSSSGGATDSASASTSGGTKLDVGAGETATDSGGGECQLIHVDGEAEKPQIILILDKSGTMDGYHWEFMGENMTRWKSLYLTVEAMLNEFDGAADFGAELFPKVGTNAECNADDPVTVAVAADNAANILATIPGAEAVVAGRTPTGHGVQMSRLHLTTVADGRPQVMILVADGQVSDSCNGVNTDAQVITMLEDAAAAGIPTYVVGIDPDANTINELNDFAEAGGVPLPGNDKFYNAQDANTLFDSLGQIVAGVLSCTIPLSEVADYPEYTKVNVGAMEWPEITDCNTEDGWYYSNEFDEITLCGLACDALKAEQQADIEYHCPQG